MRRIWHTITIRAEDLECGDVIKMDTGHWRRILRIEHQVPERREQYIDNRYYGGTPPTYSEPIVEPPNAVTIALLHSDKDWAPGQINQYTWQSYALVEIQEKLGTC